MFVYVRHNLRCIYVRTCKMYVSSGALIGFVNTGSINTHLSNLGHLLEKRSGVVEQPLAKTMLVVMVRGCSAAFSFPTRNSHVAHSEGTRCSTYCGRQLGAWSDMALG